MRVNYQNAASNTIGSIGSALVQYKHIVAQKQIAQNTKTTAEIQREQLARQVSENELLAQHDLQKKYPGVTLAEAQRLQAKEQEDEQQKAEAENQDIIHRNVQDYALYARADQIAQSRNQTLGGEIYRDGGVSLPDNDPNVVQARLESQGWQFQQPYESMGNRQYNPVQVEQQAQERLQANSNTQSYLTPTAQRLNYTDDNYIQARNQYKDSLIPKPPTPVSEQKESK